MISLRPIRTDEFPAYAAYFVPDYAAEIVANYGGTLPDALAQAAKDLSDDLPQGADTAGEILMCIVSDDAVIGYVFYALYPATKSAFIKDFHVLPSHQGHGHGTAALTCLQHQLNLHGITQIRLRVAANNTAAHRLYTTLGFFPTGINMAKNL